MAKKKSPPAPSSAQLERAKQLRALLDSDQPATGNSLHDQIEERARDLASRPKKPKSR